MFCCDAHLRLAVILALDTETTGFPLGGQPDNHPGQPRLVQLGLLLLDDGWIERASVSLIVRPDGWEVPAEAANVHGITTEVALACGVPALTALSVYTNLRRRATALVAHNAKFDLQIMAIEIARSGKQVNLSPIKVVCTMELAKPVLRIPTTQRMLDAGFTDADFKPPSLAECHQHFFGTPVNGAHDALADARACARIYYKLSETIPMWDGVGVY
jgi:DNA polymerase III subunit epsilon